MRGNHVSFPCKIGFHSIGKENHDTNDESQSPCHLPISPCSFFQSSGIFKRTLFHPQEHDLNFFLSPKKTVLFIYLIVFLLFIDIETLATIHKYLSTTDCSPEYYDFILGITTHKEQRTEKFVWYAIVSTRYQNLYVIWNIFLGREWLKIRHCNS